MVATYEEWVQACKNEAGKLRAAYSYLNEEGRKRKCLFDRLVEISEFCSSAREFVSQIDDAENLDEETALAINDNNTQSAIKTLRKLAEDEEKEAKKRTYYVTFSFTARFVTAVEAVDYKEAIKEATSRYTDADFGEAEDIDGEPMLVEDEDGNYVWEKN